MANDLVNERSPYLQRAAQEPVQWRPWSLASFDSARNENKPVLLTLGAMWCHRCLLMDRDHYHDPDTARMINDHFIAVKVDIDEHPEVARVYRAAVKTLSNETNWPLTVFLTPEGDVFSGGSYVSSDSRFGVPGFREILKEVIENYGTAGSSVRKSAAQIRQEHQDEERKPAELEPALIENAAREMVRNFDFVHGGFGESPCFPHPAALEVLMAEFFRSKDSNLENLLRKALDGMSRGGIHDQLGGAFHRYAAGPDWGLPSFEKLLSDNASMLRFYTRAFSLFNDPRYRETAEGIFNWVRSVMCDKDGGFYNSQAADSGPGDNGSFYTWTLDELREILTEKELQVVRAYYNIRSTTAPNVLHNDRPLEDIAEEFKIAVPLARSLLTAGKDKLYWARIDRPAPPLDTTLYTRSNSQMATALLEAGRTLHLEEPVSLALRTLDRMIEQAWTENGFTHILGDRRQDGLLEDQVFAGLAFLDAYFDSQNPEYLKMVQRTIEVLKTRYQDVRGGGFFDVAPGTDPTPLAPHKPLLDTPAHGANPAAALFFMRLRSVIDDPNHSKIAENTLHAFASLALDNKPLTGAFYMAAQLYLYGAFEIYIVGNRTHPKAQGLCDTSWANYRPRKLIHQLSADTESPDPAVRGMIEFIRQKGKPMAFVCVQGGCTAPVEDPEDLQQLILSFTPEGA